MRVCTAKQMAAIDRETIAGGVPGERLMERAGHALTEALLDFLAEVGSDHEGHHHGGCEHCQQSGDEDGAGGPGVLILCGKGNNGGDGLVMARLLAEGEFTVTVMLLDGPGELSNDALLNFGRLPEGVTVVVPAADTWPQTFEELAAEAVVVVDAIFGTGITPPLRGAYPDLIRAVNDAGMPCFSVDIPSGVCGDDGRVDPVAVAADITVTVGVPKLGLLLSPGRDFAGDIEVVDIGFPEEICARHAGHLNWLPTEDYLTLLPPRPGSVHKYDCGRVLVLAGSRDFGGAAHLAGLGALRSGAGLVMVAAPLGLETSLRIGLPEAVIRVVAETASGTIAPLSPAMLDSLLENQRAMALGPGLGNDSETDAWIIDLLAGLQLPAVVDADALNAFARTGSEIRFGTDQVVLTPHAGELARLAGMSSQDIVKKRFRLVADLAARWNAVLMLKGCPSLIGAPDGRVFINPTGDDALARGGSGDVLTGLVAGLLAQGLDALSAALLGAYVHGRAGTVAARGRSNRSVLVREIAAAVGPVFEEMEQQASRTAGLREKIWPVNPDTAS